MTTKQINKGESSYRRFLSGDKGAVNDLVALYGDSLVRYAYCYVKDSAIAEDIMEDAFASLLVKRKQFSDGENLRAYLYKITRNKCVDYLRYRKRNIRLGDYENLLTAKDFTEGVEARIRAQILYKCLNQLAPQYAEVLCLTYLEENDIEEVCLLLKKSKKQVYNLLARAKTALKPLLEKEGISYENE